MFALERKDIERALKNAKPKVSPSQQIPTVSNIRRIFLNSAIPLDLLSPKTSKSPAPSQTEPQKSKVDWAELRRAQGVTVNEGPRKGQVRGSQEYRPPSYNNYSEYNI